MNLATGLIAPSEVNVHKARDVGIEIIKSMFGQNPLTLTIKKSTLVIQIPSSHSGLKKNAEFSATDKLTSTDPQLLFQRALNFANNDPFAVSLEEVLEYELYPVFLTLFDANGFMRSSTKAQLATWLCGEEYAEEYSDELIKDSGRKIVIDGGALLFRVSLKKQEKFCNIIRSYRHHIINMVGSFTRVTIVFDGYLQSSTKDHCHRKRQPVSALAIAFSSENPLSCEKQVFLSNKVNKQNIVNSIGQHLNDHGHWT